MKTYYVYFFGFIITLAVGLAAAFSLPSLPNVPFISSTLYLQITEAAVAVIFGYISVRLLSSSVLAYGRLKPRVDEGPIARLVRMLGYIVIFFFVLSAFDVNLTGALVGAGFLGIVVGLASQSTLGNLFAGISMMAAKPFVVGDRITFTTWQYGEFPPSYPHRAMLPGHSGVIHVIGLMYTKLLLDDGTVQFVPNGIINQAAIINYTASEVKEVDFRVELQLKTEFSTFKRDVLHEVGKHKRLSSMIKERAELEITDVGISNYGVDLILKSAAKNEAYVKSEAAAIMLRTAKKYAEKK